MLPPVAGFVLSCVDEPRPGETLVPGSLLAGRGWAISESDIATIGVYLGDSFLCYAEYGQHRPEIGRDYAHYAQAHHSGFTFSVQLGNDLAQAQGSGLEFRFRTEAGGESRRVVPLNWPKPDAPDAGDAARPWPIRLALDECRIDGAGRLRLRGWALGRSRLTDLQLFLDDTRLHAPQTGLARPDIGERHPGYPDAGHCGFMLVQKVDLPEAGGSVRVRARGGGLQRQIIVPLETLQTQRRTLRSGGVSLCCDMLRLGADGQLAIAGWAVGVADTREIEVLDAGGGSLGLAETGLPRPDIGNRFPDLPGARFAGFRFHRAASTGLDRGSRVTLAVRDTEGDERRLELRLPGGQVDHAAEADATETIHAAIDTPRLVDGAAVATLRGNVTIAGWAACGSGIASVRVWSGETDLGCATLGGRREDIASSYPDLPGALTAGFTLSVPHRQVGDGAHDLLAVVTARAGASTELACRIVLAPDDDSRVGAIRASVPFSETALRLDLLRRLGAMPEVTVVIRGAGGADARRLAATLDSLRRQTLESWQAIVLLREADDAAAITAQADADPEIASRVSARDPGADPQVWHETGRERFELLCVLRAGDRLGADALIELAVEARLSGATFVYADERRFDPARDSVHPFHKPAWSPDLLLSTNYIGRPWCATRELVGSAGVDLRAIDRLGDYDTVLRLTERATRIAHTPLLLAERIGRRPEPAGREQAALEQAVHRRGIAGSVLPAAAGQWRLRREVRGAPLVSVIIATCGARGLIRGVIAGLRLRTDWPAIEIICLDDIPAVQAPLKSWLATASDRVLPMRGAFNWSRANNFGARAARGDLLLFLNDDIEIRDPEWLAAMVEHVLRPEVGAVGPQLLYPDGKVQHAGMFLRGADGIHAFRFAAADEPGAFGLARAQRDVTAVTGACLLVRQAVFAGLGGFDESHGVIKNDLDFCLRLGREGLRVIYTPYASLIHHEMASRAHLPDSFDVTRFDSEWALTLLRGDRLVNPNLSAGSEDYLADPEPVQFLQPGHPLIDAARVRRILVVKLDHIGDFIASLPAFAGLHAAFPAAEITLLAPPTSLALAPLCPAIDHAIAFEFFASQSSGGQRAVSQAEYDALAATLAPLHFDLAVDFRLHADTRHVLRYTAATLLAGFDHGGRFPWLDVAVEWEGDLRLVDKRAHVTDTLLRLSDALANAARGNAPSLAVAPAPATLARLLANAPAGFAARRLVCIHPGAGTRLKEWPATAYAGLITLLLADHAVSIVLIGSGDEVGVARAVADAAGRPDAVLSLAGQVPLADLPLLLQSAVLFVGNDSGPKHLAGALGVPTVGVHASHVDAAEWGPLGARAIAVRRHMECGPCYIQHESECPRGVACLRGISPAQVYRACRLLLGFSRDAVATSAASLRAGASARSTRRSAGGSSRAAALAGRG